MSESYEQAYELADPFSFENPDQYQPADATESNEGGTASLDTSASEQDGYGPEDPGQYQQAGWDQYGTDESQSTAASDQGGYTQEGYPGEYPQGYGSGYAESASTDSAGDYSGSYSDSPVSSGEVGWGDTLSGTSDSSYSDPNAISDPNGIPYGY